MTSLPLTLRESDPRVVAARRAEKALFDGYELHPEERYVLLPEHGIRVRVLTWGDGEPLVVVPGNTGDVFPLASLLARFKDRRIVAINRPGGGLSEGIDLNTVDVRPFAVTTLDTVLEAMQLSNVDVVAHSMGAHWSLWLAIDRPERVRRLALLGNPGNVLKGKPPLAMRLALRSPLATYFIKLLSPKDKSNALRPLRTMGHTKAALASQPAALGEAYYHFRRLPHYGVAALSLFQNIAKQIDAAQLAQVAQPTLLVLGDKDTFASVETGREIVAALPKGQLHIVPGAGHLPWLEGAKDCADAISAFIAS